MTTAKAPAYLILSPLILSLALASVAAPSRAARETVESIAAVIDGDIITMRELEKKAKPYLQQLDAIDDAAQRTAKRREILQRIVDIDVGEKLVTKEIEKDRERLAVGEPDIDRAVAEVLRMNNLTREQLQAAIYGQGLTWKEYRDKLREQIARARLIQYNVQGKIQINDADATLRCEQRQRQETSEPEVCASHILLRVAADASAEQIDQLHARASQLQSELTAGGDFAAYAFKYSDDKSSPDGNLGCFRAGEMVEAFEMAAFATGVGQLSPVVRTQFGFHIIKVNDQRATDARDCRDPNVLDTFRNELYQEAMEQQMKIWIEQLRRKAFVDVRL